MDTNDKDKWIDEAMNSLEGMRKAQAGEELYQKIESRIATGRNGTRVISLQKVSVAAACILLLVLANVFTVLKKHKYSTHDTMQSVVEYYQLNNSNSTYGL